MMYRIYCLNKKNTFVYKNQKLYNISKGILY